MTPDFLTDGDPGDEDDAPIVESIRPVLLPWRPWHETAAAWLLDAAENLEEPGYGMGV